MADFPKSRGRRALFLRRRLDFKDLLPAGFKVLRCFAQQLFKLAVVDYCSIAARIVTGWHDTPPANPDCKERFLRTWNQRLVPSAFAVK